MPNTWSQLYVHAVFSTKLRQPSITPELQPRLHKFMGGIVRDLDASLIAIGGMPNHVHLLVRYGPALSIASLMKDVKSRSSLWAHEELPQIKRFGWQVGGGVFSVSKSQSDKVQAYIENQEKHHKKQSFEEEYLKMLRAHNVDFDERYVFD